MKNKTKTILLLLSLAQSCLGILDSNGNGMSDVWERKFGVYGAPSSGDIDLDGHSNLAESLAGTDPNSDQSMPGFKSIEYKVNSFYLSWNTLKNKNYIIQGSTNLSVWNDVNEVLGNGLRMNISVDSAGSRGFYRVKSDEEVSSVLVEKYGDKVLTSMEAMDHDTDSDGLSDVDEILYGTKPFNPDNSELLLELARGSGVKLVWDSEQGRHYQIQSRLNGSNDAWINQGVVYIGNGSEMQVELIDDSAVNKEFRLEYIDIDTDSDGLSDWEEHQVGLNPELPKTDHRGGGDLPDLIDKANSVSTVSAHASRAVANITRLENGGVKITRAGGIDAIIVDYSVTGSATAGTDYESLSGSVVIPFAQDSIIIPIIPIATSPTSLSESVVLTIQNKPIYNVGVKDSQQINVIREVALNVKNYGAIGNGLADDTIAIQLALSALEQSQSHNTLFFPAGTYRLNTVTPDLNTGTSIFRILEIGEVDLNGRDLIFYGETGSELYSTTSPERAHMLVAHATFRSLSFKNMNWRKDSVPLRERPNVEPNGADAVSIVYKDARYVEEVMFNDCRFVNCHGAMHTYGGSITDNGKLKKVGFYDCVISNPFGANTVNSVSSWGGGQQCKLGSWVGLAEYLRNDFDGGSDDMTDPSTSPGGRLKDGCHFGSPMQLIFNDNAVRRMGVEAVLQDSINNSLGSTSSSFNIPPADGISSVNVGIYGSISNYFVGQFINIRTQYTPTSTASNNIFEVVGVTTESNELTLKNTGNAINAEAGVNVPSGRKIYLQNDNATTAEILRNVIDGKIPSGGRAFYTQSGLTVIAKATIKNNFISGFWTGINLYDDPKRPIFPASRGCVIDSNVIITRNAQDYANTYTYGIQLRGGDELVSNNLISTPVAYRTVGVVAHNENSLIRDNYVNAWQSAFSGRYSRNRSSGVATSQTSKGGVVFTENRTWGFDVGVGRAQFYQDVNYSVNGNVSYGDALPVDPLSLILGN